MNRRAGAGELRRRSATSAARALLVALDQPADVFLDLAQIGQRAVHPLEQGDDVALEGLPVRPAGASPRRPSISWNWLRSAVSHGSLIWPLPMPVRASRSVEESSLRAFRMMIVRSGRVTIPAM